MKVPLNHWRYFLALEADLKTLSRFIELHPDNYSAYSTELTKLLLASGSEVDVMLKELAFCIKGSRVENKIKAYRSAVLGRYKKFWDLEIVIPSFNISLSPWKNWQSNKNPDWWNAYDRVKHYRTSEFKLANLKNVMNTMAALYATVVYYYMALNQNPKSDSEFDYGVLFTLEPEQDLFFFKHEIGYKKMVNQMANRNIPRI